MPRDCIYICICKAKTNTDICRPLVHTPRNIFVILLNQTEIRFHLQFPYWFGSKQNSTWFTLIGNRWIQSDFGLIYQDSGNISRCVPESSNPALQHVPWQDDTRLLIFIFLFHIFFYEITSNNINIIKTWFCNSYVYWCFFMKLPAII